MSVLTIDTSCGDSIVRLPIAASLGPVAAVGSGEALRLAPKRRCSKSRHLFHSVLLPDTVTDGVFFDMEANFGFGRLWRRFQQWAELLEDFPQRYIVNQQRFVYLGQASENGRVRGDILAHFHESPNDIDAHSDGTRAVEYVGGHERHVFGKRDRQLAAPHVRQT